MDSSPPKAKSAVPHVAGVKRPAPSLLPAFEPFPSSPPLPRPAKRQARASRSSTKSDSPLNPHSGTPKYPTPIPTSSTGVLSSSPNKSTHARRQGLKRTMSMLSERVPLSTMPTIELRANGEPILMGRSGKSSHYQLSTNKLISRVHLHAEYIASDLPNVPSKIMIMCLGWNGIKVHCQGKVWELSKDSTFTSESEDVDIMIDVQDSRVLLRWPRLGLKALTPTDTDSGLESENSARQLTNSPHVRSPFSSPLRRNQRLQSPVSPSPAAVGTTALSSTSQFPNQLHQAIKVYEDELAEGDTGEQGFLAVETQSTQRLSQPFGADVGESQESGLSALSSPSNCSDRDEENDPIIASFSGPFGPNLLPRMAAFTTGSPERHRRLNTVHNDSPSLQNRASSESLKEEHDDNPVVSHVIYQLAYSRLSSTPLSLIMGNMPSSLKVDSPNSKENKRLSLDNLKTMIDKTPCIGEVCREGKDAAGKPLESEYYYIPDLDLDEKRRDSVVEGLRKPGLRECRKQHKQYYWRRPKN